MMSLVGGGGEDWTKRGRSKNMHTTWAWEGGLDASSYLHMQRLGGAGGEKLTLIEHRGEMSLTASKCGISSIK